MTIVLFDNATTDGNGPVKESNGFQGMLHITGDLDGGTLTIKVSSDGDTGPFTDIIDQGGSAIGVFTGLGAVSQFSIPKGMFIRATLAGSTAPSLTVKLV